MKYRCVLIFQYREGPYVTANQPTSRDDALRQFALMVTTGAYEPHTHRRALVMADADYRRATGASR